MANFNFNELELALINAAKVAYEDGWFDMDGGLTFFEVRKMVRFSVARRTNLTVKPEYFEETFKQADAAFEELIKGS